MLSLDWSLPSDGIWVMTSVGMTVVRDNQCSIETQKLSFNIDGFVYFFNQQRLAFIDTTVPTRSPHHPLVRVPSTIPSQNHPSPKTSTHSNRLKYGDPGRTRTCCLKIRNLALYPDELRDHRISIRHGSQEAKKAASFAVQNVPQQISKRHSNARTFPQGFKQHYHP